MGTVDGIEVRAVRAEEADDALRVLCAAFGLSYEAARPIYYQDPFFDLSHKRLLRTPEDGILSCLTVVPTQIQVGAARVALGGIAGVATWPGRQRQGWASRLLAATVPALAEELGYPLSGLFPSVESFYQRFGWETASRTPAWRGRVADLPSGAEAAFVRPLAPASAPDRASVRRIHAAAEWTGACTRDDRRWRIIEAALPEREWIGFQAPSGPVTGYAIWERLPESGGEAPTIRLLEMRGMTPEARRGLVGYLARHLPPTAPLEWATSVIDRETFGLPEVPVTRGQGMMLRIVDLPAALAAVHALNVAPVLAGTGRALTVRAVDPLRPENERPVRLTESEVAPGSDADRDWIAVDIRALAQSYLGACSPSELHSQERLRASSPSALALADALFPVRCPFVAPLDQF